MRAAFPNITILGGGLLGGSLALALTKASPQVRVRLWVRRLETVAAAHSMGIHGATANLSESLANADLLILAVPVGAMAALVSQTLEAGLPDSCLITDVGSVKRAPHQDVSPLLVGRNIDFIGSHPMAGSERGGLTAVSPDLFRDAACILTNDESVAPTRAQALEDFWQSIGCRTTWMDAASHDALVARISHLPHIIASGAARVCLKDPSIGGFGGGGLRDTTRIASGNPDMWAEILTENRSALLGPLRETLADLGEILTLLENADQEVVRQWLVTAKSRRDASVPPC